MPPVVKEASGGGESLDLAGSQTGIVAENKMRHVVSLYIVALYLHKFNTIVLRDAGMKLAF